LPLVFFYLYLVSTNNGVVRMVLDAGSFVKVILLILLCFSVMAWAVIIHKYRTFKRVEGANARFLRLFRSGKQIHDIFDRCVAITASPLSGMMKEGYREFETFRNDLGEVGIRDTVRQNIMAVLEVRSTEEVSRLRRYLVFLAVTSSVCPFFGLLGTVWGVMDAFIAIGRIWFSEYPGGCSRCR